MGHERSVLNHVPRDLNPPYMASRGDEERDEVFTFYVEGDHHSEALWRNTIPSDVAREAARVFVQTGRLDDRLSWEEM